MSWWMMVPAAVSAISSIWGGKVSSDAADDEARRAMQYANVNARNQIIWGEQQAQMSMAIATANAQLMAQQVAFNRAVSAQAIEYNVDSLLAVDAYNQLLYEEEVNQIYNQHGLESQYLHVDIAKASGKEIQRQAGSGTIIGQDANAMASSQVALDGAMAKLVLDTNAVNQAAQVQNAAAKGTWETEMAVSKVRWEGEMNNITDSYSAMMQSGSNLINAFATGEMARLSASNRASEILNAGEQQSSAQQTQSDMYWLRGLTSGTSAVIGGIGNSLLT